MSCSSAEELFERFLDGEVTSAERSRILGHLDTCANCRTLLEELRVVDALLLEPRRVELAPNFTFATMSETCALGAPLTHAAPIRAYVVSYLAAAWLIAAALLVLAPQTMHALAGTVVDVARSVADAVGGLGAMISRTLGRSGSTIAAMLGALFALDVVLVVCFGAALKFARPRWVGRLRS